MAKLASVKRLVTEDFPDQKSWIGKLLQPLNQFLESAANALNKGLTFADNIDGVVKTIEVDGTYPLKIAWDRKNRPMGVWLVQCRKSQGTHTTLTAGAYIDWEFTAAGLLQINGVTGISPSASSKFTITFVAVAG